uniref:energy transducer TonB n=1 Tax=Thaumasiovibrio occultus TaxID=1891184 RepID=UPI000B3614CE|nr:energy transducer TonB [Thaumasiovibrio occultus]
MRRVFFAIGLGLLMTTALFTLMAWMVNPVSDKVTDKRAPLSFDMLMTEKEETAQRRQRTLPEPPPPPEPEPPAPQPEMPRAAAAVSSQPVTPVLDLAVAVNQVNIAVPSLGQYSVEQPVEVAAVAAAPVTGTGDQDVMPISRVEPRYPARALRQGITGYVQLSFTIDASGSPTDINVVSAEPARVFNREAIRALSRWRYQPMVVNGEAVAQPGRRVTIEFQLAE